MIAHREDFENYFIDDISFEDNIENMRINKEWGDNPELQAMADMKGVNVEVHLVDDTIVYIDK